MRSGTALQSLAALAACLLVICLTLGLSAVFLHAALKGSQSPSTSSSHQLKDAGTGEDRTSGGAGRTRGETVQPAAAGTPPQHPKETTPPSDTSSSSGSVEQELVRPVKVWPRADRSSPGEAWQPIPQELLHLDTGHYRAMKAEVWDPHPRYEFKGFGRTFRLDLRRDRPVSSRPIKVLHVWRNSTRREETGPDPRACMYTGQVLGDPASRVSLSLCHGMRGHIWTSEGSFTIEPAEAWRGPADNMLHTFSRLPAIRHSCHIDDDYLQTSDMQEEDLERDHVDWTTENHHLHRRRKRSYPSEGYTIELMVAVDHKMEEFHGADLNHYIINLITAVDKIFKDPSIGNPMSVALVNILVLKMTQDWTKNASYMLNRFCEYQHSMNVHNDSHPEHHDVAIFLTREKVCREPERNRCDSIGLAEVGGICRDDNKQSCAIVKDMGLTTVFTIAHELGHVLSLPHDSSSNGSKCHRWMKQWDKPYLMASVLSRETRPWVWSNCSRHLLTAFLEEGHGWCLQDSPLENLAPTDNFRPLLGETFNLDKQCEFAYGKGYTLCPRLNTCVELWCQNSSSESDTCSTSHVPWADGTPCGHGKWCQKRQCVSKETLKPVHGGWSKWQRYGDCSRTCGGGVRMSVRECNNPTPANGGKYCLGERIRHHSCNIFECPPGSEDFREQQCAKFNNRNFNLPGLSPRVRWVPKYDGISPEERCKLYCRNYEDKNQYFELKEKVIDGTVCGPNTFDICVNGICLPAGCDHALYSDKQLDHCGQCGGNNSTCKVISGAYNITQYNYRSVITIPAGASNLEVRQHGYLNSNKDNSHLALFDNETGQYFLNGNFQVSGRKLILYGGTTIEYTGSEEVVEMIRASRPLTKDLNIQVFSFATLYPPDITYEFTVPKHSLFQYSWGLSDEWTPCDKVCNGRRTQIYKCLRGWQEFSPELCSDSEKGEPITRQCNTDCSLEWRAVGRSDCSSDCGAGYREIKYECVVWEKNGAAAAGSPTEEYNCQSLPRPPDSEPCEGLCVEPNWIFSPWGECSKSCGGGVRRRKAYCMDSYKQKRNDSECPSEERKTEETCNNQECPTWKVGEWTACSVTCGGGQRHRAFWCEYNGKRDSYEKCPLPQPSITDPCNDEPCAYWIEEDWSECSVTCGKGEETRHVYCSQPNACSNNSKPMTIRSCYMPECSLGHANAIPGDVTSRFTWRQKWSECSVSCGKGETRSTVECHDNIVDKVTDFRNCAGQYPPPHGKVDICYMSPCPRWVLADWEPCSAICGPGSQSRRITCESHSGLALPESACPPDSKPAHEEKRCHIVCPQRNEWIKLPWSQCSVSCGTGIMVRKVVCHGHCRGPKPPMSMACDAGPCAEEGTWNVGAWSQCSASCGEGSQERQVRCQSRETGETLPESYCSAARRPARTQVCQSGPPCQPVFKWEVTRWTPCSSSCGRGMKRRHVECKSSRGETVRDEFCLPDGPRRPRDTKPCKKSPCPFDWHEGDWSQCSSSCGPGVQQRKVRCVKNYFNGRVRKEPYEVNERFCNPKTRPEHKKDCEGNCNNKFKWETGAWHPCDKPCSRKGKQKRSLYCYYGEKTVPLRFCPKDLRPKRRRKCETIQCPSCRAVQEGFNKRRDGEYQLWLRGRNVTIFCYNMQGSNPTEYISLPNDNYAEIFSPSNRHTRRCSGRGGMSSDVCETDWLQAPYGFTFFKKIHINVSSLIIDTTDWTFATTMKGSPVSYGEAGDCHTRGLCPVGKFTINLQSTGFRVSPTTTWVGLGQQHAPPHIEVIQDGQKVVGQCGGCCGFCKPRNGLKLDLLPP